MLSNNMRSRLVNIPRLGKVGDEVDSKDKINDQSNIELIRYYMICKHKILRSSSEI
jgi:hypothetical protein